MRLPTLEIACLGVSNAIFFRLRRAYLIRVQGAEYNIFHFANSIAAIYSSQIDVISPASLYIQGYVDSVRSIIALCSSQIVILHLRQCVSATRII